MATYNLTENQKQTLRTIVKYLLSEQAHEPFGFMPVGGGCLLGEFPEKFSASLPSDLQALCNVGLLQPSLGNKDIQYSVTQFGYDAVKNEFEDSQDNSSNVKIIVINGDVTNSNVITGNHNTV